jgi:hypothetical protein
MLLKAQMKVRRMGLSHNAEPLQITPGWQPILSCRLDERLEMTLLDALKKGVEFLLLPFGDEFHTSIFKVSHRPCHGIAFGDFTTAVSESHPLNSSGVVHTHSHALKWRGFTHK